MEVKLKKLFLFISLCTSTILTAGVTNITAHENIDGWTIYDNWPQGVKIEKVNDAQRGSVIKVTGKLGNGVRFLGWEDNNDLIQWKMKGDAWSAFYVVIQTRDGFRYLTYSPKTEDTGIDPRRKFKIKFGLGSIMKDGKWHTFTRDVKADLKQFEPDNEYLYMEGIKFKGGGSFDDIKTMRETTSSTPTTEKEIFIIGPSTVHFGIEANNVLIHTCETNNPENILMGWAERFQEHSRSKVYDFARLGSNVTTFRQKDDQYGINQNWDSAYSAIKQAPKGSFLLIQFGANQHNKNSLEAREVFKNELLDYINSVKRIGMIPVLITSVDAHRIDSSEGRSPWVNLMRQVANDENVLLLDLMNKSNNAFIGLTQAQLNEFGDCLRIYKRDIDRVHLSPNGANIVAGWVKELACDASNTHLDREKLCSALE